MSPTVCPDPVDPISFPDPALQQLAKGAVSLPPCYPPGKPDTIALGPLIFHRSCFRVLSSGARGLPNDYDSLSKWITAVGKTRFIPPGHCDIDGLGKRYSGTATAPDVLRIAREFTADYPPPGRAPRTAAEAIVEAYQDSLDVVDHCFSKVNPKIAHNMRRAMGILPCGKSKSKSGPIAFRPEIDCRQQLALRCASNKVDCKEKSEELTPIFNEPEQGHGDQDPIRRLIDTEACWPAHPDGKKLGSIETASIAAAKACKGAVKISIFDPTAMYSFRGLGGPSTVVHEFLHAAEAKENPNHNHGTEDNVIPAGDQVYACQAIAFKAFYELLNDDELRDACHLCAGIPPKHDSRRHDVCDFPTGKSELMLRRMGCRKS